MFLDEQRSLAQAGAFVDRSDLGYHNVLNPDLGRMDAVVGITENRICRGQHIRQGYQPDEFVIVVHDRQMVDAIILHQGAGFGECRRRG